MTVDMIYWHLRNKVRWRWRAYMLSSQMVFFGTIAKWIWTSLLTSNVEMCDTQRDKVSQVGQYPNHPSLEGVNPTNSQIHFSSEKTWILDPFKFTSQMLIKITWSTKYLHEKRLEIYLRKRLSKSTVPASRYPAPNSATDSIL
jgi:hypothetical protein